MCIILSSVVCIQFPFLIQASVCLQFFFKGKWSNSLLLIRIKTLKQCVFKRVSVQIWSASPFRILQVSTLRGEHLQSAHLTLGPTQCVWWLHHKLPLSISSMRGQLCRCCATPEVTNQHMWLPQNNTSSSCILSLPLLFQHSKE